MTVKKNPYLELIEIPPGYLNIDLLISMNQLLKNVLTG